VSGGTVIHVTILDCFYPVNVEILCSVFQYHGQILKIIIFTKKGFSLSFFLLPSSFKDQKAKNNRKEKKRKEKKRKEKKRKEKKRKEKKRQ